MKAVIVLGLLLLLLISSCATVSSYPVVEVAEMFNRGDEAPYCTEHYTAVKIVVDATASKASISHTLVDVYNRFVHHANYFYPQSPLVVIAYYTKEDALNDRHRIACYQPE